MSIYYYKFQPNNRFDCMNGETAETPHAIAIFYISVSLVFEKRMINWTDDRFRYYVMKQV
ncbi:hypothetical protein SCO02_17630 [Staphylococcus ureilyticus]|uniref:Uncharacterized protein n=1 Tax=Staphylococcus ureilyticus TaxID=94138 RepID=A0AB34AN69_STAUR|nr:hypothetical protein SCO02_17630 [Staphylococcus ureilyticus]